MGTHSQVYMVRQRQIEHMKKSASQRNAISMEPTQQQQHHHSRTLEAQSLDFDTGNDYSPNYEPHRQTRMQKSFGAQVNLPILARASSLSGAATSSSGSKDQA